MSEGYVAVASTSDIPQGEARVYECGGQSIAVCRAEDGYYAVANVCTHDDGPLGEGCLHGHAIECPRHGAKFDIRDGRPLQMPAVFPTRVYNVRVEQDQVWVKLEES